MLLRSFVQFIRIFCSHDSLSLRFCVCAREKFMSTKRQILIRGKKIEKVLSALRLLIHTTATMQYYRRSFLGKNGVRE